MQDNRIYRGEGMDPSASVYEQDGSIYRKVYPEFVPFFQSLLRNNVVQEMIGHELVSTSIEDLKDTDGSLILRHQKVSPLNYPFEWSSLMLKDAAELTLKICIRLLEKDLILKDATPWNIVFDRGRFVFVDFSSIMPVETELIWVALDQFSRLFLFPLLAAENGFSRACRSLMFNSKQGISSLEISKYLPAFAWLKKPWLIQRLFFPRMLVSLLQKSGQDKEISKVISQKSIPTQKRIRFFHELLADLDSVKIGVGKSRWSQYYSDMEQFFKSPFYHPKQQAIDQWLQELKPQSVTDIGSNTGGYAIIASLRNARVTAFDTDEDSINMLYRLIIEKNLDILPLVMDVTNPSPKSGWRAAQYLSAVERFRSDGALALALVHHLAITQNQSFDRITDELSDYCDNWLITEFIPISDPRTQELLLTSRRDMSWYTLDNFLASLKRKFGHISTRESYPQGRTLIHCIKPR